LLDYIGVPTGNTYTVARGDSLWSIARKFNVSVEDLKLANNLSSSLLNVGQVLKIPTQDEPITGDYVVYTVSSGDSLYSIANRYGVSVNELIEYNNLASTNLSIGQQILIPSITEDDSSNTYIVKAGDSLYSIANKYGVTVDELKSANNLTSNILLVGQKLTIPGGKESVYYVVKAGDSLYSIANKYGVTVDELKRSNGLTSNILSINQRLIIPDTDNAETYTVKSGDSLYSIASRYNTSVNELKSANNLTSNLLSVGQILIIP